MFLHYHGQRGARLNRNQSVHQEDIYRPPTYLFLMLSPLLFFLPDNHIRQMEEVFVDGIVNERPWNQLWDSLRNDWEAATTPVCHGVEKPAHAKLPVADLDTRCDAGHGASVYKHWLPCHSKH